MTWLEAITDKTLQDLPYKIELDEWGNVVMRPISNKRSMVKAEVMTRLSQHQKSYREGGVVFINCSVQTSKGVKVADVVWASALFMIRNQVETPYRVAPELCIDIVSRSDAVAEMSQRRDLYFAKGATEVWTCDEIGRMSFFNHYGEAAASELFPDFPSVLELEL